MPEEKGRVTSNPTSGNGSSFFSWAWSPAAPRGDRPEEGEMMRKYYLSRLLAAALLLLAVGAPLRA